MAGMESNLYEHVSLMLSLPVWTLDRLLRADNISDISSDSVGRDSIWSGVQMDIGYFGVMIAKVPGRIRTDVCSGLRCCSYVKPLEDTDCDTFENTKFQSCKDECADCKEECESGREDSEECA